MTTIRTIDGGMAADILEFGYDDARQGAVISRYNDEGDGPQLIDATPFPTLRDAITRYVSNFGTAEDNITADNFIRDVNNVQRDGSRQSVYNIKLEDAARICADIQ